MANLEGLRWRPDFKPWKPPPPFKPLWKPPPLTSEERRASLYWKALTLPPVSPRPEWKPVYLRFGELPEGGRSLNHRTARFEAGVAAFRAYETCEGEYLVDLQKNPRLALILVVAHYAQKRPAFVLEGQPLKDRGDAGEPLLGEVISCEPLPEGASIATTAEIPAWIIKKMRRACSFSKALGGGGSEVVSQTPVGGLAGLVTAHATTVSKNSSLHGPQHWQRVAATGLELCQQTPGADEHVVLLFAAFHDSRRFSDGPDPDHGERGAALARELRGSLYEATDEQMALIEDACIRHTRGEVTTNPTIGACWDADRLDLPRVGIRPDPAMLSTNAAKQLATKKRG